MDRWKVGAGALALVAALAAALPEAGAAQAAVGLRAGFRSADVAATPDANVLNGLAVGGYFGLGLSDRLGVQVELVYGNRGASKIHIGDGDLDPETAPSRVEMTYLEIPVLLRSGIPGERLLPSFFVGPYVGILFGCELTPSGGQSRSCDEAADGPAFSPRATDYGLTAGAGLDLLLGETSLFVDARYSVGLLSIEAGDGAMDARHNGFTISGGFAVPLGR